MDDIGKWNSYLQAQLPRIGGGEKELIMSFTMPLQADQMEHRVGWDLKRPGRGSFVAISSGLAIWHRGHPHETAEHIVALLEECNRLLEPIDPRDRR